MVVAVDASCDKKWEDGSPIDGSHGLIALEITD